MIDRKTLVSRHNPTNRQADPLSPLTVGNGSFAFTADVTGLQTYPEHYLGVEGQLSDSIPLGTQASWGWHSFSNPHGYELADSFREYDYHGRPITYPYGRFGSQAVEWLRANPHRLHLGRIGLDLRHVDGAPVELNELDDIEQALDLWTGTLRSRFTVDGELVLVQTWCDPAQDALAVRVQSALVASGRLHITLHFPYGSGLSTGDGADWDAPERHQTSVTWPRDQVVQLTRTLDDDGYVVDVAWQGQAIWTETGCHRYALQPGGTADRFNVIVRFAPAPQRHMLPTVSDVANASARYWERFWSTGGAIELAASADPRAFELERRVVLSQYLTAIQSTGDMPPQETGLTYNSWFGKFHLEMHWWHAVHFALWDRLDLLLPGLFWYGRILPMAQATARRQGFAGARWPKMVGPAGRESPSNVGPFLLWQQPHPIYFAELCYRADPTRATLERYRTLVIETAVFMADFAAEVDGRYVLGPPMIPAQERFPPEATFNATYELAYWDWGLRAAQTWRQRLGLGREPSWDQVLARLSPLPVVDGVYVNAASHPDTFGPDGQRTDHPSLLAACGVLPEGLADVDTMRRTLHRVWQSWSWEDTWGWDFPMTAMTAARVGEPEMAVEALLMDVRRNTYLPNGHNYNRPGLAVYLPGNGGVLAAVAMMAAGWDGAPDVHAPGFPQDGSWTVRWEGLRPMP